MSHMIINSMGAVGMLYERKLLWYILSEKVSIRNARPKLFPSLCISDEFDCDTGVVELVTSQNLEARLFLLNSSFE